ncbi:MAG: M28 family peptidase [Paludibacteraceae bacterium]|jgi:hypothetical protein|nr:M28 family peptidase [Paludibacteraceae bacterium]
MRILFLAIATLLLTGCVNTKKSTNETDITTLDPVGPIFMADSAYLFCQQQCDFGPRVMNSDAHERCGEWIADKFRQYGAKVTLQRADLRGYDGTILKSTNIIAAYRSDLSERILLCAHWDSRPWADNDPDESNHRKPVMAANDGASGVAVMLELARLLSIDTLSVGIDFVCFDAEDWGTPQWADTGGNDSDTWALGAQFWASENTTKYRYGILLDMVGGQGAKFYQEGVSLYYAPAVVKRVWAAAEIIGYGSMFPKEEGSMITDDHVPVNQKANIPCIDIIPYYADCKASSFGPTWHTVNDDMQHIDKNTLQAVGQTMIQLLYSEK